MKNFTHILFLTLFLLGTISTVSAQQKINGQVLDRATDEPLIGANVQVKNTALGAVTDLNGNFSLDIDGLPVTLVFSYSGFVAEELEVNTSDFFTVALESGIDLDDVVVVGARFRPRTVITSPVPIDNIKTEELITTGQQTFDKMLHYSVPSFNSTQQTISDATAHFDPADLRGLGPSRTLVLVNGKRKNASSLVYINDTPGKGEVGVDMKSIPVAAIERIEILRDGASAQYGSDAIAGVINLVLKDDYEYTNVNIFSGITTEGDGFNIGYDLNTGFKLGKGGFLNLSTSFSETEETNRAPTPGKDLLFGNIFAGVPDLEDLGNSLLDGSHPWLRDNPGMGMIVGQPQTTKADVFYNGKIALNESAELYSFGGLTYRRGTSYALYRAPYWVDDPFFLHHNRNEEYQGFHPTFESEISDRTFAVGVRGKKGQWDYDLSNISGSNTVDYIVDRSLNQDLGGQSPTLFRPGGYEFRNNVTNLDLSRSFGKAQLSLGSEFRTENFVTNAGDEPSWFNETGNGGAQSFPGLQPPNAIDADRYNIGVYADLNIDVTPDFLFGGALRFENYSDFGETFNWKVNARYKFNQDRYSIRASASSGFRAPSLHQIYLSNVQTLVSGGTISNQGTFNNQSTVVRALGVPKLKEETSLNFTAGIATRPINGLYITLDYYRVQVDDRVIFSSSIATDDTTTLVYDILQESQITSLKFFANAVNTITSGIDFVARYNMDVGSGNLGISLAANFNSTEIDGQITTPAAIAAANVEIFDRKEQSRILSARPDTKVLFGLSYGIGNLKAVLNNTYFGEVTWQHAGDPTKDQTFGGKLVTDLYLDYRFNSHWGLSVAVNNLLNVYPDKIDPKGDFVTDLGGRFQYPWEVNQFGFNGTIISGKLNIRF